MQPNNKLCNIVATDGTNSHTISMKFIMSVYIRLRTFWMPLVSCRIFMQLHKIATLGTGIADAI